MTKTKTQKPPRTIKGIVEDLRARGELDEEKWRRINSRYLSVKYFFLTSNLVSVFIIIYANDLYIKGLFSIVFVAFIYSFYYFVSPDKNTKIHLFNAGDRVSGYIRRNVRRTVKNTVRYIIDYDYGVDGEIYAGKVEIAERHLDQQALDSHNITVLYLKENPSISTIETDYYKNFYCIRKES